MSMCPRCGINLEKDAEYCSHCGFGVRAPKSKLLDFLVVTSPTIPGYQIKRVVGVVTGLTARTRGFGGKVVAGIQSLFGGEISAFTVEIEKARIEALNRMIEQARDMGANAVMSVDLETSDLLGTAVIISATGTAVEVKPE